MKIIVDKETLLKNISKVLPVALERKTLQILECILVEVEEEIIFTATDMNTQMQTEFHAEILEKGNALIKARMFYEIVRKMPENTDIIVERIDNEIVLKANRVEFKIPTLNPQDFPKMDRKVSSDYLIIDSEIFTDAIKKVEFSVGSDDKKPYLKGILFEKNNEKLNLVSLDGHRLCIKEIDIAKSNGDFSKIVPAETLRDVVKIIDLEEATQLKITFFENQALFELGSTNIITTLITGKFFDYKSAIPDEFLTIVNVNSEIICDAIERATIVTKEEKVEAPLVIFEIMNSTLIVESMSVNGRLTEEILCSIEGKDLRIGFNAKYWLQYFGVIKGEIQLLFSGITTPALAKINNSDDYIYLVLPVRIPE